MDTKLHPRTDAHQASIVRQGLEWSRIYGQRSAAAWLLFRQVPRAVVERILATTGRKEDQPS